LLKTLNRGPQGVRRTASPAVLAVVLLIGAAGCADSGAADEGALAISPSAARQAAAGIYVGTGRLDAIEQKLISTCMRAAGFDYQVLPQQQDRGVPQDYADDVARARTEGYGLAAEQARTAASIALDEADRDVSPAQQARYREALSGPPDAETASARSPLGDVVEASTQGCRAKAWTTLYGSVKNALAFSEFRLNTVRAVLFRARADSAPVQDALKDWQACMADRGYPDMEDRNSARGLAFVTYDDVDMTQAREFELKIAEADATCDKASGYSEAARPVEDEALARFITDHEAEVTAVQEIQRQAVAAARNTSAE